jgi:hypothetical protein
MPRTRAAKAAPPQDAPPKPPAKPRAPRAKAAAPVAAVPAPLEPPAPAPLPEAPPPAPPAVTLKKKALVEQVAQATGAKRKLVKSVVEATLAAMGDALSRGEELVLPPLGRARVNRSRGEGEGATLMIKLRRGGGKGGKEGLAEPDEAD